MNRIFPTSSGTNVSGDLLKKAKQHIKTGKKLDLNEQEFLVNQLFSCKEPLLSPDNQQIFITLNKNDIENKF